MERALHPIGRSAVRALANSSGKNEARFTNQTKLWPPLSIDADPHASSRDGVFLAQTFSVFRSLETDAPPQAKRFSSNALEIPERRNKVRRPRIEIT
jgi:hypothetical protein